MTDKKRKINTRIKVPDKRNINLAVVGQEKINVIAALIGTILIAGCAAVFSKTAVVDRFAQLTALQNEETSMQQQVSDMTAALELFDTISEDYEHYTYSGMTDEEVYRADRMEAAELLNERVFPYVTVDSWTLSGNELYIPMKGESLDQINQIVQSLESDSRVNFCTVTTAVTEERVAASLPEQETEEEIYDTVVRVKGNVTCYLNTKDVNKSGEEVQDDGSTEP